MTTIYLSGGIAGLIDEEAYGWRKKVRAHYYRIGSTVVTVIPTRLQYRPDMDLRDAAKWLVKRDKFDILRSDIVLAYCPRPSWGTAMEIIHAYKNDKWVVVVCDDPEPSPWLLAHSDVLVGTFEEAYTEIGKITKDMLR